MRTHTYRAMMASVLIGTMTFCGIVQATPYYWDTDGSTGGFGNVAGTWGTSAFWSTDNTGASATALTTITTTDGINFGTASLALGTTASAVSVGTVNVGTITFGAGQTTPVVLSSGTITLAAAATITVNNTSDTISSILAGAATSVTKDGTGTLTLGGNNTYSGATTVSVGTLKAGSTTGLSTNSAFSVAAGATLDLGGYTNTIKSLAADTATSVITNSTGSAMLKVSTALGSTALAQLFAGSLGLQIFGGGNNSILGNANSTYSGGTLFGNNGSTMTRYLSSGTIGTGSPGAVTKGYFGTGTITMGSVTTDKSQFYLGGSTTINNPIVVNTAFGDGSSLGAFRLEGGPLTLAGTVNANLADVMFQAQNGSGRIATVTGAISGNSGLQVYAQGASGGITVILNNTGTANSYAGNTVINNANSILTLGTANQIPNGVGKGNLIITNGVFNLGGFSETINGLSGSGIVDGVSGTPTLTVGDNNANSTFSGIIKNTAGSLALIKTGNGTLTLSNTNTYSGNTTINAGRLQGVVGGGGANSTVILNATTATNSVSITDNTKGWTNAALTVSSAGVLEFNFGAITPSTTISPLKITGLAAFTATPTVSVIVNTSSLAAGIYPLMTWGSYSGTVPTTANLTLSTMAAFTVASLSVSGNTLNLVITSMGVYWDNNGATAGFGTAAGTWASPTIGNSSQGWSSDATGNTLPVDFAPAATNFVSFGNGATGLAAGTITVSGVVTNGAMIFDSGSGAITLSGGTITFPATGTITVNNTSDTISSVLAGAGTNLTKAGTGTLTLSGNNTYSGATTVNTGTLKASSTTGLSTNSAFSVAAGAFLDLGGFNNTIKSLSTATGTITDSSGAGLGSMLKISTAMPTGPSAQLFTGSMGLQFYGGNTVNTILSNTGNTYSGGTILGNGSGTTFTRWLGGGTIGAGSPGAVTSGLFGTGTITIGASVTDMAQFYFAGGTTINNDIVVNSATGGTGAEVGAFRAESSGVLLAGAINANMADVTFNAVNGIGNTITVTGAISGNSGVRVTSQNASSLIGGLTVTLNNAANTYAGNTIVDGNGNAILTLGAANQIPNGTGKGNLIVTNGKFNMGGFSETVNGLSGTGIVDGVSGTLTLTVGDNNANSTFSGVIKNTAGTLALTKIGSGTLTLSGTNTYSGSTTINAGRLQGVVGGGCANSTVILNVTTATNSVSITDNTKGWTNAALTVSAAGVLEFNFGAITPSTTISPLKITGLAAFTATPTVSVLVNSGLAAGTYPLMTWDSTSGTVPTTANLTLSTLAPFTVASLTVLGNTLNLLIVSTAVYWDNNGATAGFGTAAGTWASLTTGDAAQGWSFDTAGGSLPADFSTTLSNPVNFGNGSTGLGAGTITVSGVVTNASMTFASGSGAVTLSGGTITFPPAGTITVNNTSDTISSVLAGAGSSLTKAGTGTLTLSGTNTYVGATTINAGTLKAGSTTGLSTNSAFSVAAGAALDLDGYNNTIKSLGVDTATSTITSSSGSPTLKVSSALGAGTSLPHLFAGNLAVQITGANNTIAFANANNTYSGGTILGNGSSSSTRALLGYATLGIGIPGALTKGIFGTGAITLGANATDQSQIMFQFGANRINNAIVVNSTLGQGGSDSGAFRVDTAGNVIAGTINANLAPVAFHNNDVSAVGSIILSNRVFGASGLTLLSSVGISLNVILANTSLVNTNTYAGDTIISSVKETLTLGAADQIPNGVNTGNVTNNGTFNMTGYSEALNGLSGSGIVDGVSGTPTLTVGDNNANGIFSGVIKNTAGTLSLIKIGSGTLTLSGTNTYSGATGVSNGTLSVNGSLTNANITVAAGATLAGSGMIRCRVSVSTNDLITVSGTATLSDLTLALDVQGLLPVGSYVLAKGLGATQFKTVTGIPQQATKSLRVSYGAGQLVLGVYPNGTMVRIF